MTKLNLKICKDEEFTQKARKLYNEINSVVLSEIIELYAKDKEKKNDNPEAHLESVESLNVIISVLSKMLYKACNVFDMTDEEIFEMITFYNEDKDQEE